MSSLQAVTVNVVIERPQADCWAQLRDLSVAHNYVPGLSRTQLMSEQVQGEGAHRRVYTGQRYLEETVSEWREGAGFTLRLHRGARAMAPFREAEFEYALAAEGETSTRATLTMRTALPWGAVGRVAGLALQPVMRRQLRLVAAGLKHFYETGTAASDEDRQRLLPAVRDGAA